MPPYYDGSKHGCKMDAEALRLLSKGAQFYVCGHASMAREVGKESGRQWGERIVGESKRLKNGVRRA